MIYVNKLNELICKNLKLEAIELCKTAISEYPDFSFYSFWLERLENNKNELNVGFGASKSSPVNAKVAEPFASDLANIATEVSSAFSSLQFDTIAVPPVTKEKNTNLEEYRKHLVKKLPYVGEIYLPTNKIDIEEQLVGLENVHQIILDENKKVSSSRFNKLKDIVRSKGKKRIFVIGNGPSIKNTDLSLLKDEITIGFNGIFLHESFKPTIYVVEDHLVAEDRVKEITDYECPVKIFPSYLRYCLPIQHNTIFLNHLPRKSFPVDTDFSDNAAEITYTGGTVTYTGLQIAASLGFDEIYLIGVDASYKVENVDRSTDYGTGVLCSKSDDVNHFDSRYFGKGYRWHDPNVHTMLQAYRKVRNYAQLKGKTICNATIGGELEVFPRVNYYDLFPFEKVYPKTAVIDFTHIDWLCATGIVKKNMFAGWAKHSLFHVHGQNPDYISAYQSVKLDCYASGADTNGIWAALRTLMEYNPDLLYIRPTHDRPALTMLQLAMPVILNKPFVVHYMDDWLAKVALLQGEKTAEVYKEVMAFIFKKANKVLTISQKMSDFLHSEYGVETNRLQVVHNYIQDKGNFVLPKDKSSKVVRYFGGMEPDMSLASIVEVAKAVEALNTEGRQVRFEIYTAQEHIDKYGKEFTVFNNTVLKTPHENYQVYLALLENSDVNVLCYNFDEKSKSYLKYSMANKLPETIGANVPFLAIGSKEIGTITYLLEEEYPFVVSEQNQGTVRQQLASILFDPSSATEKYFEVVTKIKEEFSESKNRIGFQRMLRAVSNEKLHSYSDADISIINNSIETLFELLGSRKQRYESAKVLKSILKLPVDKKQELVNLIQSHGVDWQFKLRERAAIESLDNKICRFPDYTDAILFLITSLDHDRFNELNNKIKNIVYG